MVDQVGDLDQVGDACQRMLALASPHRHPSAARLAGTAGRPLPLGGSGTAGRGTGYRFGMASEQGEKEARRTTYTRRQFMEYRRVMDDRQPFWIAKEDVAAAALEHPNWDLDEEMTWAEWTEWENHEHPAGGSPD
jgi:hypothetical protein